MSTPNHKEEVEESAPETSEDAEAERKGRKERFSAGDGKGLTGSGGEKPAGTITYYAGRHVEGGLKAGRGRQDSMGNLPR